jgi:copper chaperone NosL
MKTIPLILLWVATAFTSCSNSEYEPIQYGKDNCHWCYMRIMDPKFGAEAVTTKGRIYKFDAAECMINYLHQSEVEHKHLLVTDYDKPSTLTPAENCFYLVSEKMMSPMGGNLNAFETKERAERYKNKNGGTIYTWKEIVNEYTGH